MKPVGSGVIPASPQAARVSDFFGLSFFLASLPSVFLLSVLPSFLPSLLPSFLVSLLTAFELESESLPPPPPSEPPPLSEDADESPPSLAALPALDDE